MGGEKGGPKSKGFFHIFDWNRKSRKKLFSVSPESTKQVKKIDDSLAATKLGLHDEDETVGVSSLKGSSDYSCASSVTDEEGNGTRVPGVVARLMGLNSMPVSSFSEPYSTPLLDKRSLADKQNQKRSTELFMNDQFNHIQSRTETYTRKPIEFRTQKMPSSPIERFQTETLPPRSVKPVCLSYHKLLSPIKTLALISPQNKALIMEEAVKILEHTLPVNSRAKSSPYGSLKINDSKRTSRALELTRKPVDSSDFRYLKGQSLNRSWNDSEDSSSTFRPSPDIYDTISLDGKGKGKSVSLAVQAKANVQRREGLSIHRRNASFIPQDVESKINQPFKSQASNQKNKQQKKASTSSGSCVLIQNNQKQNCLPVKGKVVCKHSVSNQQERKCPYQDKSSVTKNTTKRSGSARVPSREASSETFSTEIEGFLSNKDFPQKKRLIDGDFKSHKVSSVDNIHVVDHHKRVHPNIVIDEQSRLNDDKINGGADVVSFAFTTPLVKTIPNTLSSNLVEENCEKKNIYKFDSNFQKNSFTAKRLSPPGLSGDALSLLLEQKLRELTSSDESSYSNFAESINMPPFVPIQQVKLFDIDSANTNTTIHKKKILTKTCKDQKSLALSSGMSSTNGHVFGLSYKFQESEEGVCISSNHARNEPEALQKMRAPPLESCESSLSTTASSSSKGSKKIFSSFEAGLDLSDSASSSSSPSEGLSVPSISRDLDYTKEIVDIRRADSVDLASSPRDHILLFNKLERRSGGKDGGMARRKMLFDCVNECLDNKCDRFLRAGYQCWANGEATVRSATDMAKEVLEQISRWKGFGDCIIDELVDRDMSSHRGRWLDFKMEAFELGEEIEEEILTSFIEEFAVDCRRAFCVKN